MNAAELNERLEAKKNEVLELQMKADHTWRQICDLDDKMAVLRHDWATVLKRHQDAENEVAALEMAVNLTTQ